MERCNCHVSASPLSLHRSLCRLAPSPASRALEHDTSQTIASSFMVMAFGAFAAFTLIFVSYIFVAAQGNVVQVTPPELGTYMLRGGANAPHVFAERRSC